MLTDPIADFLTRIRNAQNAGKASTFAPNSRIKIAIAEVLKNNKYISDYKVQDKKIEISFNKENIKLNLKRVSKPGQRIYVNNKNIPKVLSGMGIALLSTSEGIMTGKEAKKKNLGGELLCTVY
ncbi:30S ribosomal protein S8 [Candidatus Peregrinibacteria bacterium RIFOXYB2_FULL_32_7]|nr:MAG: 30S ribosomal protein S8 [Candidatus Peregrinibacteria bacterium RIFOXYB2_FULL_32_7]